MQICTYAHAPARCEDLCTVVQVYTLENMSREYVQPFFFSPILKIGDQVLTFDVFWPKYLQEVRPTVDIHVQSI